MNFQAKTDKKSTSIGYHGNVVEIWEKAAEIHKKTGETLFELGSDQTSCHNPFNGGYYPVQLSFQEGNKVWNHYNSHVFYSKIRIFLYRF